MQGGRRTREGFRAHCVRTPEESLRSFVAMIKICVCRCSWDAKVKYWLIPRKFSRTKGLWEIWPNVKILLACKRPPDTGRRLIAEFRQEKIALQGSNRKKAALEPKEKNLSGSCGAPSPTTAQQKSA